MYELPDDYWGQYIAAIGRVSAREVVRAARRYLRPEEWAAVVVGDVRPHLERLARFGDVTLEEWEKVGVASP